MTYPQDPFQQSGGYPQQPPPKSKTGLIVGIVGAVVVLAALGITGFVAPGFFLSDDRDSAIPAGNPTPTAPQSAPAQPPPVSAEPAESPSSAPAAEPSGGTGATAVLADFIAKVNSGDAPGAADLACPDFGDLVSSAAKDAVDGSAEVSEAGSDYDGQYAKTVKVTGMLNGGQAQGLLGASTEDESTWCIQTFSFS